MEFKPEHHRCNPARRMKRFLYPMDLSHVSTESVWKGEIKHGRWLDGPSLPSNLHQSDFCAASLAWSLLLIG